MGRAALCDRKGKRRVKIEKVWAVYFSGTGTTEKVVTALAQALARDLKADYAAYCFNTPRARERELHFRASELAVVGVPTYAGRVPNLLLPYVRDALHGNGTAAVPVVLYGNRNYDDALMELRNVLFANGFCPVTAGAFVGEHSFSRILGAGRPDAEDMALVEQLERETVQKIRALAKLPAEPVAVKGCDPIRPYYTPRDRHGEPIRDFLKAKPVTDSQKCIRCGMCVEWCPMGSIDPADVTSIPGKCIKCCACVKRCPAGAKYFDHAGYLYHQHELEDQYARCRAPSEIFF